MNVSESKAENGSSGECVQDYERFNTVDRWMLGALVVPIVLLGLATNIISVCVFSRKSMRKQLINYYLLALGISDCVLLTASLLTMCMQRFAELTEWWSIAYFSILISPICNVILNNAYYTSVWITVGMYVHRFIGIWFPLQSGQYLTARNVRRFLVTVPLLALAYTLPKYFELKRELCMMRPIGVVLPWLTQTSFGTNITYRRIRAWISIGMLYAVPFVVLAVVNTFVIIAIRRSQRLQRTMGSANVVRRQMDNEIRISTMLVLIVLSFLFSNTPIFFYNVLVLFQLYMAMDKLSAFANFAAMSNPLLNAIIYWFYVPKYRLAISGFLFACNPRAGSQSGDSSTETQTTTVKHSGCFTNGGPKRTWTLTTSPNRSGNLKAKASVGFNEEKKTSACTILEEADRQATAAQPRHNQAATTKTRL